MKKAKGRLVFVGYGITAYDLSDEIKIASIFADVDLARKFLENTGYSCYWEIPRLFRRTELKRRQFLGVFFLFLSVNFDAL